MALDVSSKRDDRHAGLQRWHTLAKRIKDALEGIHSAPLLHYYGLPDVVPNSTQQQVAAAKSRYFESTEWAEQRWGGTLEMFLLSHHQQGKLGFLLVTPGIADPLLAVRLVCAARSDGSSPPVPPLSSASPHVPAADSVRPDSEIALHFCSKSGAEGSTRNHWELIQYQFPSPLTPLFIREYMQVESADVRDARHAALLHACKAASKRNARATAAATKADAAVAMRLDRDINHSDSPQTRAYAAAATAPAPAASTATQLCYVAGAAASPSTAVSFFPPPHVANPTQA
jgi:hypothetical protein